MTWEWVHFQQLFLCKHEMYSCDQSGFSYLCQGMAYVLPCTCFHQREQQQWPLVLARATAVLHLHWRGISYWALITVLIYKGNRSLSFKSQYCQITLKSWHGKETDRACPSFPERNCFLESSPLIHISHLCPSFFCSSVQKSDTILMNYNFIKRKECTGVAHLNTYIVWLWLSHWNPFKDTQWSVSNRHPFFLPVNC